ncbi:hypothetical protein VE03_00821 [Pseudogymnoascus sp. 23342-1-I1]|nr:hypothetical protein VE03_00821 [Pseudogymnoascus sp. 23342-1-I1]
MASVQLQTLDQQGSSSATSSSISQRTDRRSSVVEKNSLPKTSVYSPRSLPEQQQQQQQQEPSQERRRPQRQATLEETRQLTQELQTQPEQGPEQGPQRNGNSTLLSLWSKIVKNGGFIVAVLAFILGIGMIAPTVGQYTTGVWSAAKDYQEWCKGEQSVDNNITDACALIIDRPLPPPPGLSQVFRGIRRRDFEIADASMWNHLVEKDLKWSVSSTLFTVSMLAMGFKGSDVELVACSVAMGYLIEEAWFMLPLRSVLLIVYFIWEPWFAFDLGYVLLCADWAFFLQLQDKGISWVHIKELSWLDIGLMLNMCRIGYTSRSSRGFQYLI